MDEYLINLRAFKELIENYTIADLKSMIYDIESKPSGACCYPAIQTLFSLLELIGKLIRRSGEDAFVSAFKRMGGKYDNETISRKLYEYLRNGIAHNSLAKGGVKVKKSGDREFHFSNNGMNIDIKIMFEDFLPVFDEIFKNQLQNAKYISEYKKRLKNVFKELEIQWINQAKFGGLNVSADYTRTGFSIAEQSGASITQLKIKQ